MLLERQPWPSHMCCPHADSKRVQGLSSPHYVNAAKKKTLANDGRCKTRLRKLYGIRIVQFQAHVFRCSMKERIDLRKHIEMSIMISVKEKREKRRVKRKEKLDATARFGRYRQTDGETLPIRIRSRITSARRCTWQEIGTFNIYASRIQVFATIAGLVK